MPKRFQQLTLRERLASFPPWLILAMSHVRTQAQTRAECQRRLWSSTAQKSRWKQKQAGQVLPRKPMWRRPTYQEIADRSRGLNWFTVRWIAGRHLTWDHLTVDHMLDFTEACGFSLTKANNAKVLKQSLAYQMKQGRPFQHLTKSQRKELEKKLVKWRKLNQPETK